MKVQLFISDIVWSKRSHIMACALYNRYQVSIFKYLLLQGENSNKIFNLYIAFFFLLYLSFEDFLFQIVEISFCTWPTFYVGLKKKAAFAWTWLTLPISKNLKFHSRDLFSVWRNSFSWQQLEKCIKAHQYLKPNTKFTYYYQAASKYTYSEYVREWLIVLEDVSQCHQYKLIFRIA